MSKNLLDVYLALKDFEGKLRGKIFFEKYPDLKKMLQIDKELVRDLKELPEELYKIIQDFEYAVSNLGKDTCDAPFPWRIDLGNGKEFLRCPLPKNHDGPHKLSFGNPYVGVKFSFSWEDTEKEES